MVICRKERIRGSALSAARRFPAPLSALLALLVVAGLLVLLGVPHTGAPREVSAASVESLKQALAGNRDALEQIRADIAAAEVERKAALGDITALDQQIEGSERDLQLAKTASDAAGKKLTALQKELTQLKAELVTKTGELRAAEKDLARQQNVYDRRIVDLYKSGGKELTFLAALLEPGSLSHVLGRVTLLSIIADRDQTVLTQIGELRADVDAQKTVLETERAQVVVLQRDQKAVTKDLQAEATRQKAALTALQKAKSAKQRVLDAATKDKRAAAKQEDELLAESDRIGALIKDAEAAAKSKPTTTTTKKPTTATTTSKPPAQEGRLHRPVPGSIGSGFGYRYHPISGIYKMHTGVDMHATYGTPIHAGEAGRVIYAGWRGGYGKCVVVEHGGGLSTLYAHQSGMAVSVGQRVSRGQVLGYVGSTGYSTGPHLHFEVRVHGDPVNPAPYL